jgi:hypothetical protein
VIRSGEIRISIGGERAELLLRALRADDDEFTTTCIEEAKIQIMGKPETLRRAFDDLIRCLTVAEKTIDVASPR